MFYRERFSFYIKIDFLKKKNILWQIIKKWGREGGRGSFCIQIGYIKPKPVEISFSPRVRYLERGRLMINNKKYAERLLKQQ